MRERYVALLLSCLAIVVACSPAITSSAQALSMTQMAVLDNWLAKNAGMRLATIDDCKCLDDVRQMRAGFGGAWRPIPNYDPYVAIGDFNGDRNDDLAVAVIASDPGKPSEPFALVVFNGPFNKPLVAPSFVSMPLQLTHRGLFFGDPRPRPYRLLVGPFESEAMYVLVPDDQTYRLETNSFR
jgi:hypothetical protein